MNFPVEHSPGKYVLVFADRWVDVRHWARARFGEDAVVHPHVDGDRRTPSVSLRWVGHDAGPHPNLHMEVREDGEEWRAVR